jgi:hypothetical protein
MDLSSFGKDATESRSETSFDRPFDRKALGVNGDAVCDSLEEAHHERHDSAVAA